MDIGRLDVAVLAGYPGSIAGTWQQMGRAGRRGDVSVAVLVASPAPVDQYVIHHPEFVLGGQPEEARLDPDNLHVLLAHLRCADVRAAVRARRVVRARAGGRPARVPRRGRHGPPGGRRPLVLELGELPRLGGVAAFGRARERRDHRHDAGPAARARRGRPVQRPGARPPARDLHARLGAVPRRPARLGRAQGVRPPDRRGPLHVRQPRRDPQAARRVRRGALDRRHARPRRGDGREPRDAVQEAQVRHRRERGLGPDRPAGDRAPDDRLLAHRRGGAHRLAARRARRRADRRGAGDPGGGGGAADARPARPRARVPGPLAAPRGADDLPVRGDARRRRAVGAAVGAPRTSSSTGPRTCSAPARARPAARRAPARGSSPTWTARRSRCACSRRSAPARRASRPPLGPAAVA